MILKYLLISKWINKKYIFETSILFNSSENGNRNFNSIEIENNVQNSKLKTKPKNSVRRTSKKISKFIIKRPSCGENLKLIGKENIFDSQNSNSTDDSVFESTISETKVKIALTDKDKIHYKSGKINSYWNKSSMMIPNVFRYIKINKKEGSISEHQDLSKKEVLPQNCFYKESQELFDSSLFDQTPIHKKKSSKRKICKNSNN